MPRINITLAESILTEVDKQAGKEERSRSGHIAELVKQEKERRSK